jgi:hypothetical protein
LISADDLPASRRALKLLQWRVLPAAELHLYGRHRSINRRGDTALANCLPPVRFLLLFWKSIITAMNRTKNSLRPVFRTVALLLLTINAQAQAPRDSALAHHRFVFLAYWATAYNGERSALTPPYELSVTSDSIGCYLPYAGRMYTTPGPQEQRFMSIAFTSRRFDYTERLIARSGRDITIRPKDVRDVQVLNFSAPRKGWATLTIRSAGRDRMVYEGTIEPIRD